MVQKLTLIERRRIERIAFAHPFFDRPHALLSKKEARDLLKLTPHRSGAEVIAAAYEQLGIEPVDTGEQKPSFRTRITEVFTVPVLKRIAVVAAVLLLLSVVLIATPVGKAAAEDIRYFIEYIDGRLYAKGSAIVQSPESVDFAAIPASVQTPRALAERSGLPVIVPEHGILLDSYVEVFESYECTVLAQYETEDGITFTVEQFFFRGETAWGTSTQPGKAQPIETDLGLECWLVAGERTCTVVGFGDNTYISVIGMCTADQMQAFVAELTVYEP